MNINENPQFLKNKFNLHKSEEVKSAARRINIRKNIEKKNKLFDIYDDFQMGEISKKEFDKKNQR